MSEKKINLLLLPRAERRKAAKKTKTPFYPIDRYIGTGRRVIHTWTSHVDAVTKQTEYSRSNQIVPAGATKESYIEV